jgi:hypothetical protein
VTVVRVYRPVRDWKAQRPKELEDSFIGTITGVIVGGASPQDLARFPNTVSTEGQLGIPYDQESEIVVEKEDLLVFGGVKVLVTGPRQWEEDHEFFGGNDSPVDDYYWVHVKGSA